MLLSFAAPVFVFIAALILAIFDERLRLIWIAAAVTTASAMVVTFGYFTFEAFIVGFGPS